MSNEKEITSGIFQTHGVENSTIHIISGGSEKTRNRTAFPQQKISFYSLPDSRILSIHDPTIISLLILVFQVSLSCSNSSLHSSFFRVFSCQLLHRSLSFYCR